MLFWPFMLLTVALTAGLGFVIAQIERDKIISNWSTRRCNVPIMAMGSYFKPKDDPRTPSQFSKDNFSFCMDSLVKTITAQVMTPLGTVFSKQAGSASVVSQAMNAIRVILKKIYDAFMEYIDEFMRKYNNIAQQIRTVTLHLKAAFGRVNTMMISLIYIGLTLIRGMMNTIDLVFKIVLIICGIMVAIIIILWFILLPVIPIILAALGAILAVAVGTMAVSAASYKNTFCFSPTTRVVMNDKTVKPISTIKLGDVLQNNILVDSIMKISGNEVPLWNLNGIYVSGTHLVMKSTEDGWHPIQEDPRAVKTNCTEEYVYCLNTSTHTIPIQSSSGETQYFRDWEELDDIDTTGHYEWNYTVLHQLNRGKSSDKWPSTIDGSLEYPAISGTMRIKTPTGHVTAQSLHVGDTVCDQSNRPTRILGIIQTTTHISKKENIHTDWLTNMIYKEDDIWKRMPSYATTELVHVTGINIITEEGSFIAVHDTKEIILRDFTEVGYAQIESTNKCVEGRLRSQVKKMS